MAAKYSAFFPDITVPSFIFYPLEQNVDKETNASEASRTLQHFLCSIFKYLTDLFKKIRLPDALAFLNKYDTI